MDGITPENAVTLLLAVASGFVLLANAAEKIAGIVKAAKAPNKTQDDRLDALEDWRRIVDRKLDHDNTRLENIEAGDRAIQRALLALLDHGIDGNNVEQMQHAKEELQNHLINR